MVAFTSEQAQAFLERLVAAFNAGVHSGDFSAYANLFTENGTLEFEGVNDWGPFTGPAEIARRFREDPPDDEIRVTRWKTAAGRIVAEFRWTDLPEAIGGCIIAVPSGDRIARLTVALGGPHYAFR